MPENLKLFGNRGAGRGIADSAANAGHAACDVTLEAAGLSRSATAGVRCGSALPRIYHLPPGAAWCRSPRPPAQRPRTTREPRALFLAQLIAIAQGAPQTRARRRASAGHAAALYAAAATIARPGAIKVSL